MTPLEKVMRMDSTILHDSSGSVTVIIRGDDDRRTPDVEASGDTDEMAAERAIAAWEAAMDGDPPDPRFD